VSTDTFIRLETIGIKNVGVRKIFFVPVKGVDLQGDGSTGWDFVSAQFGIFTHVSCNVGNGWIEPE
jgi:hypothetical protein